MADAVRQGRKCPKGHTLDPSWDTCPYCQAEERSKQKSVGLGEIGADRRETRIQSPAPGSPAPAGNRVTRDMSQQRFDPMPTGDAPRIVGVLVTYTWQRQGQLFAVREGKNFIGRGQTSSEPQPRDCDIQVPEDDQMSQEHALILCRRGKYELIDQEATNGTFLNGVMLNANQGTDIPDRSEITTGRTVWTFLQIHPTGAAAETAAPSRQQPEPQHGIRPTGAMPSLTRDTK
jgi:FHA domain